VCAYKKLTKKSFIDGLSVSSVGTVNGSKNENGSEVGSSDKSLQTSYLSTNREHMSLSDTVI
jgi:hypothetical protein